MIKRNGTNLVKLLSFFLCLFVILANTTVKTYAEESNSASRFALVYPDNKTIEYFDTYEQAIAKQSEWKFLGTFKTDAEGLIILEGWSDDAEIKIVEKKVPEGYTATSLETIAKLSDKEVEIVNQKKEEPPTTTVKKTHNIPKTGIDNIFFDNNLSKEVNPFSFVLFQQTSEPTEDEKPDEPPSTTFKIKKVDQDKKAIEGVEFEIYGKGVLKVNVTIGVSIEDETQKPFTPGSDEDPCHPKVPEPCHSEDCGNGGGASTSSVPGQSQQNSDGCDIAHSDQSITSPQTDTDAIDQTNAQKDTDSQIVSSSDSLDNLNETNESVVPETGSGLVYNVFNYVINGIEGTDFQLKFTAGEKVLLSPGIYEINELKPDTSAYTSSTYEQSFLKSYQFEVTEKGEIIEKKAVEWNWIYYNAQTKNYVIKDNPTNPTKIDFNKVYCRINGSTLEIKGLVYNQESSII